MGCHLGWHFTVGCPLRGGRGKCKIIGTSVPPKTIKENKNRLIISMGLINRPFNHVSVLNFFSLR
jgi:hypothetical protein